MPRLPELATQERPIPRPSSGVTQLEARTGMEMAPSEQETAAGHQFAGLGETLQKEAYLEAQRLAHEQKIKSEQEKKESAAIAALRATTDFGNDIADLHQQIGQGIQTGQIKSDQGITKFDEGAENLKKKYLENLDPSITERATVHMDNAFRDARRNVLGTVETLRREQTVADFVGVREGLERRAITDLFGAQGAYKATAEGILANAGMKPNQIAADIQNFNEKTTFNYVAGQVNAASNNPKGLKSLESTLMDTKQYDALDPDKRRILLNTVEGRLETLRNRAINEQNQRLNQLGREMDSISRLSMNGIQPTADRLAALQIGVKGTPYEAEFKSYLDGLKEQRDFSQLPPAQMRTAIETDVANVAKNGGNEADRQRIQKRTQSYELAVNQLTQDPLAYNARLTGTPIPPIDWSKPEALPATLQARADILLPLNRSHGANVGLFRPDEVQQVGQNLKAMPAEQKAKFLSTIYQSVGPGPVYNATLSQLAPDSPVTAFAGQIMSKGDVTVPKTFFADTRISSGEVATRMLRGDNILNPPKGTEKGGFKVGDEKQFNLAFNSAAGKAFPGSESQRVRNTYEQAVKAVYADLSLEEGDRNGEVIPSRVKKAFDLVTGGGVVRFGDSDVLPPFGMNGDQLRSSVYRQFGSAVDAGKIDVPATYIKNANLYQVGEGRYMVQNGARFLPDKNGTPLIIDVTAAPPVAEVSPTNKKVKK